MNNLNIITKSIKLTKKNLTYKTRHIGNKFLESKGRLIEIRYLLNNKPQICLLGVSNKYVITELITGLRVPYNEEKILIKDKTRSRQEKLNYIIDNILTEDFTLKILIAYEDIKHIYFNESGGGDNDD